MDRKRLEQELSLHIDGRLPSGRREQLLDQLDDDQGAARLLEEMEHAQELARSLPPSQVGSGFTEGLWQRIRSGEGTPEAVFREPLPWIVKARYVALGAAAAAALLVAAGFVVDAWRGTPSPSDADPGPVAVHSDPAPAPIGPREVDAAVANLERDTAGSPPGLYPISAFSVAQAGQDECLLAVQDLKSRALRAVKRLDQEDVREVVTELEPVVDRARGSTRVIRWLQDERMIELPSDFDVALKLTEGILVRIQRARQENDSVQFRVAVDDIQRLDVEPLHRDFGVICCRDANEFLTRFQQEFVRDPGIGRAFQVRIVTGSPLHGPFAPLGELIEMHSIPRWIELGPQGSLRIQAMTIDENGVRRLHRLHAGDDEAPAKR